MKYNEGEAKLQLSRVKLNEKNSQYAKLGRLTLREITAILPVIGEAISFLQDDGDSDAVE